MRPLIAIALVLAAACGRADRSDARDGHDAPSAPRSRAPDALVLRVPRDGGTARVVAYPRLDSVIWTSPEEVPSLDRVLAFDDEGGVIAAMDAGRRPVRIDLRAGAIARLATTALESPTSSDGEAVYGIQGGKVVRYTPAGRWTFTPPSPARGAFPQMDGSLLVLADARDGGSVIWRVRAPETRILDTVQLPAVQRVLPTPGSDRLYFATGEGLAALRARTLELRQIPVGDSIRALVTTPSGDRVFILGGRRHDRLSIVDRYRDETVSEVTLPGAARDLRMDPLGRYLLARADQGDSAWVVAIGTGRVIGSVATAWRNDLPLVAADGAVGLVQGKDVVWVDGETLRNVVTVRGGASDFWFPFRWNGFRPRDPSLDAPVAFEQRVDTNAVVPVDSGVAVADSAPAADTARPAPRSTGWTVSFAVLLSEERARELASQIRGSRVVAAQREGSTIYRVVLGPFPSREEADRAARESRQPSYWVYEGAP